MPRQRNLRNHPERQNLREHESYRKDGRYMYRITKNHETKTVYAKTLSELRIKAGELEDKLKQGLSTEKKTLNSIFDVYIEQASIKHTTKMHYLYNYDKYVREALGNYNVDELTADSIDTFYRKLLKTKKDRDTTKNLTIATVEIIDNILRSVFKKAIIKHLIASNPTSGILMDIRKNGHKRKKRYALSVQEQAQFLDFVKNSKTYKAWYPLIVVGFLQGLRVGELTGLTWKDVDIKNNLLNINHQLVYSQDKPTDQKNLKRGYPHSSTDGRNCKLYVTTPKSECSVRTIHLFPEANEVLKELYKNRHKQTPTLTGENGKEYTDFIFINRQHHLFRAYVINNAIKRMVTACNKEEDERAKEEGREAHHVREFTCHVMRHTAATRLFESGADAVYVKNFLGHSNIQVTLNIYIDLFPEKSKSLSLELEKSYTLPKLN